MKLLKIGLAIGAALITYLLLWPVPIAPVSWEAPVFEGYVDDYEENERLANLELLNIGDMHGPEDVAARTIDTKLTLFVSSHNGEISTIDPDAGTFEVFAQTGGIPLGLEFDARGSLIVADAFKGLLSVSPEGEVTVLTNEVAGTPILFADDLDIAPNGVIYFSDASTKFGAQQVGETMAASLLEIMEHGRTGRLLAYDPEAKSTRVIKTGVNFANGVAMGPDGSSVLLVEMGEYRILKIWIEGPRAGETDVILDNLPGFPDNINHGPDGTYFVGLVSQRSAVLDDTAGSPFTRKLIWRLPPFMKPAAKNYGFILQIDSDGNLIKTWQDPSGSYPQTTGAIAPGDGWMYISSLSATRLARRPFP